MRTMTINGNETVATYYATLMHYEVAPAEIIVVESWPKGSLLPRRLARETKYLNMKLNFWVEHASAELYIGNLIAAIQQSVIKLSDKNYYYNGVITSTLKTFVKNGVYKLDVELRGYAYIPMASNGLAPFTSKTITVGGQQPTAALIQLGAVTAASLTVSVTNADGTFYYVIGTVTGSPTITLDGELCKILQNTTNIFNDTLMTKFPYFTVGSNTIGVSSNAYSDYSIQWKDRYINI